MTTATEVSEFDALILPPERVRVYWGGFRSVVCWLMLALLFGSGGLLVLVFLSPLPFVPWGTINGLLIVAWAAAAAVGVAFISIARLKVTISQQGISWQISWFGVNIYRMHHPLINHPRLQDVTYDSVNSGPDHRLVDGPMDLNQVRVLIPHFVTFWFGVYREDLLEIVEQIQLYQRPLVA
ncbi:MAG: hypothetical protein AAGK09_05520 [Planctomycetota bacterium]